MTIIHPIGEKSGLIANCVAISRRSILSLLHEKEYAVAVVSVVIA